MAALWGGNFAAMKTLLARISPADVMVLRVGGASLFFALLLLATGRPLIPLKRADWIRLLLIGLLGVTILNAAMTIGMNMISAALASLIVTSNPIHTALISRLMLGELLTRRKLAGIALAFAGLLIVLRFGSVAGATFDVRQVQGVLILALAPFSWAFYTVLSKPLLRAHPPIHVAAYSTIAGSIPFLTLPLWRPGMFGRIGALDGPGWLAALFVTLFSFVLGYVLWYRGLRVLTPSQTAVYIYLVPVFGLLSAWLILGERPTLFLLLGGATILTGVILTNTTARDRTRATTPLPEVSPPRRGGGVPEVHSPS